MKLALIVCDRPVTFLFEKYGGYPELFSKAFTKIESSDQIVIDEYNLFEKNELPSELSEYHGVIVSGSKWSANDTDPWIITLINFIRKNWLSDHPNVKCALIGICFGHQIIGKAFGGTIEANPHGWELGWTKLTMNDTHFHVNSLAIHSIHKEMISDTQLPPGFSITCKAEKCQNQGMINDNLGILTWQGHPEASNEQIYDLAKLRFNLGVISKEVLDRVEATKDNKVDHEIIIEIICKFIKNYNLNRTNKNLG